jgi:CO/xanthine dehydrogenase FAD-binding subunit
MTAIQSPKSVGDLVKLVAKHGKRTFFISGIDPAGDRVPAGKVVIDLGGVASLNELEVAKDKVIVGTGMNLGRLAREATGENGLIRQAASLIANPLVRNRVTFLEGLNPESPYFDITTPFVLLEAKVRLQGPTGKRTIPMREYLELVSDGLKKGEVPIQVEFTRLPSDERVGFFRVARMGGKGSVSASARMKLVRNVCKDPEIVVSSLSLIPLRTKSAEKELNGKAASEDGIKRASVIAATEILELADSKNGYERSLIEIAVARTLRSIMEGSIPT